MTTAVDVLGFAGGFTLGMVQAGFELVGKRELPGGFGVANCEANRHLLGYNWRAEATEPERWSPVDANVVFGNPPCSGFSVMSAKEFRGADSKINHCMWSFVDYAGRIKPEIAVFESVQPARTRPDGLALMRRLRERLEVLTGHQYTLYHVRHNAYSVGGCSERKRYFWLASRVPFGIERPRYGQYPTFWDAISDLEDLPLQWETQAYGADPSWWANPRRSLTGKVDGHWAVQNPLTGRIRDLMDGTKWAQGEHIAQVARRYYEENGKLPDSWKDTEEKLVGQDFFMGFTTPVRWRAAAPARVITGGGPVMSVHPTQARTLTHREIARVMGFTDDWNIWPLQHVPGLSMTWGKGITVDCGRWIGDWIQRSLAGDPGSYIGEPLGDREYDIDVTNDWHGTCYSQPTARPVRRTTRGTTMTETAEAPETTETKTDQRRGQRANTAELDERTYALLEEPKTRNEIQELLELSPAQAYLSTDRLRKAGRVAQERRDGKSVWFRTDVEVAAA